MATFKTVQAEGTTHRIFEGQLRVCASDKKKNYKVELMLLNELPNRNKWQYTKVAERARQAEDIPLLYSVIGGKVGNSHDFEIVTDSTTGKKYASFIGAESEHPYGWIPSVINGQPNAKMQNIDGVDWLTATAYLPSHYNVEMIRELEANNGRMPISIETLVSKFHFEGDIEVEDEYEIIGVTILGRDVSPAFANAKVERLAVNAEGLKELQLRVASVCAQFENIKEPQTQKENKISKGVTRTMKNLNLEDVKAKFNGYTVLGVNGLSVALLSEKGRCCSYTFLENEDTVVPSRIEEIAVNSVFGEGDSAVIVPTERVVLELQAKLNATSDALRDKTEKFAELETQIEKMNNAEKERRKKAVSAAIKAQLAENRANSTVEINENLCEDMLCDESVCNYANMEDKDGFCGEKAARRDVDARCMEEIRKANAEKKANNAFSWTDVVKNNAASDKSSANSIGSAIDNILAD